MQECIEEIQFLDGDFVGELTQLAEFQFVNYLNL